MKKVHTDYDLNEEKDRKKYIKSLNQRIKQLADTFGKDSLAYVNKMKELIVDLETRGLEYHESNKGIFQINESKANLENELVWNQIDKKRYLNMNTANEIAKETFKKMKERGELAPDTKYDKEIAIKYTNEYMFVSQYVAENLSYLYSGSNGQVLDIMHIKGRRKTYEELKEVAEAIQLSISDINF